MSPVPVPQDLLDRLASDVERALVYPAAADELQQIGPALRAKVVDMVRVTGERLYLEGYGAGLARAAQIQLDSQRALADLVREGQR